ncbi:unnamed protein product [Laminaria digitata]
MRGSYVHTTTAYLDYRMKNQHGHRPCIIMISEFSRVGSVVVCFSICRKIADVTMSTPPADCPGVLRPGIVGMPESHGHTTTAMHGIMITPMNVSVVSSSFGNAYD